MMVSAIEEQRL